MKTTVYVLVRVKIDPNVDPFKVIEEVDYSFNGDGVIDSEIIDVATLDVEEHPYIAN